MKKRYKPGEFAKLVNRSVQTLRAWDKSGKLPAKRTIGGHRYYTDDDVSVALNIERKTVEPIVFLYARVSSSKQKEDLERQLDSIENFALARGLVIGERLKEVGGGLNYTRAGFLKLMTAIEQRRLKVLVIAHKDRLCRFGFDYFEHFAQTHGCEIIVANAQNMSPQQELMEDLMAVIHTFSCRLYGLRKYSKKLREIIFAEPPQ